MNRLPFCRARAALSRAALCSIGLATIATACGSRGGTPRSTPLAVFNAGALALPLRQAMDSFAKDVPIAPNQESAGSVETIRKITDLARNPDIVAVADTALFGAMLEGRLDGGVAALGSTRLVLAFTDRSRFAGEVNSQNWAEVTTRPGVQVGRSDPDLDPAGYRALMAMQLAERFYHQPGLAARLELAAPAGNMRPKSADLTALLQTGNLDYAWEYESVARTLGLRFVTLPPQVDLGDPSLGALYATARVTLAPPTPVAAGGRQPSGLVVRGAPIVFGAAALKGAPHASIARQFISYLTSPAGRRILAANGLRPASGAHPDRGR